jgi:hypothetical protein
LSGLGSPLTNPKEESGSEATGEFTSKIPKLELEVRVSAIGQIRREPLSPVRKKMRKLY